jgi:hypothetical protein
METPFELDSYLGHLNDPNGLTNYIYQPVFLKTKIDVSYNDIINWERYDLLDIEFGIQPKDKSYKKTAISFMDYAWIKTVEQLRKYGFSYDDIKKIRAHMSQKLHAEANYNSFIANNEHAKRRYGEENIEKAEDVIARKENSDSYVTPFEQFVMMVITQNMALKIFFDRDCPEAFFHYDGSIQDILIEEDRMSILNNFFNRDHFSLAFYKFFTPFLAEGENAFANGNISILTDDEDKMMRIIRRQYDQLDAVTIRFKDNAPTLLSVTTTKKVAMESRLLEHIKKGDYSTIEIKSVDGRIVHFENTKQYKL